MGKYKYSDDNGTKLVQQILNDIANELAEVNRLKRIEIKILAADYDMPKTMKEVEEDRA